VESNILSLGKAIVWTSMSAIYFLGIELTTSEISALVN
jgi:hypothetical protein